MLDVREIDFNTIYTVWHDKLWPGRLSPIRPISSMRYLGGYDMDIYKFEPTFFGAYFGTHRLVGVNSGFETGDGWYRSRGIWVDPSAGGQGIGRALMEATEAKARSKGCTVMWTIPRQSAMPFYAKCGFERTSEWFDEGVEFGPNCYATKALH